MTSQNTSQKNATIKPRMILPAWAKVCIVCVIIGQLALWAGLSTTIFYFTKLAKQSTDQTYVAKVAQTIAQFPNPLPPGFVFQMAASMLRTNMVTILYKPDNTLLMFGISPSVDKHSGDPRKIADMLADKGIPSITEHLHTEIAGSEKTGSQNLEYVIGSTQDRNNKIISGMVGCIAVKNKNKVILIYGITPGAKYNFEATKTLLNKIKDF